MNEDFLDFLNCLLGAGARFLVVGAHALAVHGVPRATGDLDVWIDRQPENAARIWAALEEFGAPTGALGVWREDLEAVEFFKEQGVETVIQIGLPPRRVDLLTGLTGVTFDEAWNRRITQTVESLEVPFLDRATLVRNKQATARLKDLADLEALGEPSDPGAD